MGIPRRAAAWLALLGCTGCSGRSTFEDPAARHRALEEVRAAIATAAGQPAAEVPGSRVAIEQAWDRLLAAEPGVRVTAEYEEPPRSLVLHIQSGEPAILTQQVELMQQLPPGVKLRLVLGSAEAERALTAMVAAGPTPDLLQRADRLRVPKNTFSSVWARDFAVGDEACQVVPLFLRPGLPGLRTGPGRPYNEVVNLLADRGTRIVHTPLYFAGGNVQVGRRRDGTRVLLCGCNDFLFTRDAYQAAGLRLTEEMFTTVLRATFAVGDVVVLRPGGDDRELHSQAELMFHLDQAMMFYRDGEVLVHRVHPDRLTIADDDPRWQKAVDAVAADLDSYACQLAELGFTVSRMPISADRVLCGQYYLNSLQVPTENGPTLLIVPSFGHTAPGAVAEDEEARQFLMARGFHVAMVRDMAYLGRGSNHCLVRRG